MLFSELHASILNGKKEKKINVAVVEKTDTHKAFSQGVTRSHIGVLKQWNFHSFDFFFYCKNYLLLENTKMASIRHNNTLRLQWKIN